MKKGIGYKVIALLLTGAMMCSLVACRGISLGDGKNQGADYKIVAADLMQEIRESDEKWMQCEYQPDAMQENITDFALRLFKGSLEQDKNTLVSPLSVLMALGMTANGAKGNTLSQMQEVFGADIGLLNEYLAYYNANLPQGDKYKFEIGNSIWIRDIESFKVNDDFLKTNYKYYDADVYRAPFDDDTCKDINGWIENKTDGLIKNALDRISDDAVMYLINALVFEAEWAGVYEESQVRNKTFTTATGEKQDVKLMYSMENLYLENEEATGFIKYYKDRKYAFVAFLPKEGVTIEQCVDGLSGEELRLLLNNPQKVTVDAAIPEFTTEYSVLLNDVLGEMGMTDAFIAEKADFSGLGSSDDGNLFISRVIHKTFIEVSPKGTKAGAATIVEVECESAVDIPQDKKTVHLDRPFIYMLIDCENNQPFFIGSCLEVE